MLQRVLGHAEHAQDVRPVGLLHRLQIDVFEIIADLLHGCVIHQHIQLAKLLDVRLDGVFAESLLSDVALSKLASSSGLFDLLLGHLGIFFFLGEIADGYVGTLASKADGDGAANSGVATGDKRRLVLEKPATFIFLQRRVALFVPELELGEVGSRCELRVETWTAGLVLWRQSLPWVGRYRLIAWGVGHDCCWWRKDWSGFTVVLLDSVLLEWLCRG